MPVDRSSLVGVVAGAVLLAGCVGFAVGLPELVGDPDASSNSTELGHDGGSEGQGEKEAPTLPDLPDDLGLGLLALDAMEEGAIPGQTSSSMAERDQSAADRLSELYDTEARVRSYLRNDQADPASLSLTVVAGEAGLLAPGGPPFGPEFEGLARSNYELVVLGDTHCAVTWEQPVPLGAEPDPAALPLFTECQVAVGGLVYDAVAQRLTAEQVVGVLDEVTAAGSGSQ